MQVLTHDKPIPRSVYFFEVQMSVASFSWYPFGFLAFDRRFFVVVLEMNHVTVVSFDEKVPANSYTIGSNETA